MSQLAFKIGIELLCRLPKKRPVFFPFWMGKKPLCPDQETDVPETQRVSSQEQSSEWGADRAIANGAVFSFHLPFLP